MPSLGGVFADRRCSRERLPASKLGQKSFSRFRKSLRGMTQLRLRGYPPNELKQADGWGSPLTSANPAVTFSFFSIFRNRGPDETYLSAQCSATQEEAWLPHPDADSFWTGDSEASACQRSAAYLRLAAGRTLLFVVDRPSNRSFAREDAFVTAGWSLSWYRAILVPRASAWWPGRRG